MSIKRKLLPDLRAHLSKKEITLLVGPRQAGKTTLMLYLQDELQKKGERTLYLSLDFERDRPYFVNQEALLGRLRLEFGGRKGYVFIDEIQRKENAGIFLKGLYDMQTPYKFVVSGSGSVELKEKIHESLAGRKRTFELGTISLSEFVNYRTAYKYEEKLSEYFEVSKSEAYSLLLEYLNFGGYPRVVLEETAKEKAAVIDDIYRSYIEKDIAYLMRVERIDAYANLIRILSDRIGAVVNLSELSSTASVSVQTVRNYLVYAEKTFIIRRVTPYFKNQRSEISKSPVIYFSDLGFRNFAIRRFGRYTSMQETGFLFQNLIHLLLVEKMQREGATIHFWRTKDRAEVDFVISGADGIVPVEVKCREIKEREIGRSLRNFIAKYKPPEAWVVSLGTQKDERIEKTRIRFIPFYELI